jgi:TRIAD3 protein (E3 ubiquitin-protein ligase RNF216)
MKIEAARKDGELMECGCCYDDECLFEEMAACADGHIFCKECIRRSSESAIGEGKTKFLCLTGKTPYTC